MGVDDLIRVPGGTFLMGSDRHYGEEAPAHRVNVDGFRIERHPVTNRQFARFVADTGHVTLAERAPDAADYPGARPDLLVPASVVFRKPRHRVDPRDHHNWWAYVPGADWRHPLGPHSSLAGLDDHPVVHVAYEDAHAYATWAGGALPTEAEWELAARGGLDGATYAWGDEFAPGGRLMANTWHGEFPYRHDRPDEWLRTSPVGTYPPNGYGLYDMTGNVWEWTDDFFSLTAEDAPPRPCCAPRNPRTPEPVRESYVAGEPGAHIPRRVTKGGSHLCAANYCLRYRPAARQAEAVDTSTGHIGFRCVRRPG